MSVERVARPTLEQIRALWESRGGEPGSLPPLAGAGGSWLIPVPRSEAAVIEEENRFVVVPFAALTTNLLANGAPTIMERWDITAISYPVQFLLGAIGPAPTNPLSINSTLILKRGGDVVWSQTQAPPIPLNYVAVPVVTFATDFNNPIQVFRGQTLTLALETTLELPESGKKLSLTVRVGGGISAGAPHIQEGTVQYNSVTMTGRRTL